MKYKSLLIVYGILIIFIVTLFLVGCEGTKSDTEWDHGLEVGAVSAAHPLAVDVGQQILEEGGNAIDAAIAVSFALNVAEPYASGIGGGGFMLYLPAEGEPVFIDYREKAPAASTKDMFEEDPDSKDSGGISVAVPGQLRGMEKAHNLYGTWEMADLIAPAIEIAREGVALSPVYASILGQRFNMVSICKELSSIYLRDGFPYGEGEVIKQENLANTLSILAENGLDAFYEGELAEKIVTAVQDNGGIMTLDDLKSYREAKVTSPLKGQFGDYEVYSAPLPSSGGILLLQLLNLWKNYPCEINIMPDHLEIAYLANAMQIIFEDREEYLGDPDFVDVQLDWLTSEEYIQEQASRILAEDPEKSSEFEGKSSSTTSFVTADSHGNVVVTTQTLGFFFGSSMAVPGTGIILNQQMWKFNSDPSSLNAPAGSKVPVSSMAPTIFLKEGKPVLALGSPGGKRLITAIGHTALNYLERGQSLPDAVNAPRFHYEGIYLHIEPGYPTKDIDELRSKGFDLIEHHTTDLFFGGLSALAWEEDGPVAFFDHRRDGKAYFK